MHFWRQFFKLTQPLSVPGTECNSTCCAYPCHTWLPIKQYHYWKKSSLSNCYSHKFYFYSILKKKNTEHIFRFKKKKKSFFIWIRCIYVTILHFLSKKYKTHPLISVDKFLMSTEQWAPSHVPYHFFFTNFNSS